MTPRKPVVCGNWKMYKTSEEAAAFVKTLAPLLEKSQVSVWLAPPFTALPKMHAEVAANKLDLALGGQNMHPESEGPFTGEISSEMLQQEGASFVILGHSERRTHFHETNAFINKKVKTALKSGLTPILCIGETLEQREQGKAHATLKEQLEGSLAGLSAEQVTRLVLAYEPVWAIGTGRVAHPDDAHKAHLFCREVIREKWDSDVADPLVILYGGSVKSENAEALLKKGEIGGFLVGGASLSAHTFSEIINVARTLQ